MSAAHTFSLAIILIPVGFIIVAAPFILGYLLLA